MSQIDSQNKIDGKQISKKSNKNWTSKENRGEKENLRNQKIEE